MTDAEVYRKAAELVDDPSHYSFSMQPMASAIYTVLGCVHTPRWEDLSRKLWDIFGTGALVQTWTPRMRIVALLFMAEMSVPEA